MQYVYGTAHMHSRGPASEKILVTDAKLSKRYFVGPRMRDFNSDRY